MRQPLGSRYNNQTWGNFVQYCILGLFSNSNKTPFLGKFVHQKKGKTNDFQMIPNLLDFQFDTLMTDVEEVFLEEELEFEVTVEPEGGVYKIRGETGADLQEEGETKSCRAGNDSQDNGDHAELARLSVACSGERNNVYTGSSTGLIQYCKLQKSGALWVERSVNFDPSCHSISAMAFCAQTGLLAAGNQDGRVKLFYFGQDVGSTECIIKAPASVRSIGLNEESASVAFTCHSEAFLWNYNTGTCSSLPKIQRQTGESVLTFSTCKIIKNKVFALVLGRTQLVCWPVLSDGLYESAEQVQRSHSFPITCFSISADSRLLCAGCSHGGSLEVWRTDTLWTVNVDKQVLPVDCYVKQIEIQGTAVYIFSTSDGVLNEVRRVEINLETRDADVLWVQPVPETYFDVHQMIPNNDHLLLLLCGINGPLLARSICLERGEFLESEADEGDSLGEVEGFNNMGGTVEESVVQKSIHEGEVEDLDSRDIGINMRGSREESFNEVEVESGEPFQSEAKEGGSIKEVQDFNNNEDSAEKEGVQEQRKGEAKNNIGEEEIEDSSSNSNNADPIQPTPGLKFKSRQAARDYVNEYSKRMQVAISVRRSKRKEGEGLTFECKHGETRGPTGKGKKIFNRTKKTNCPFILHFYTRKDGTTRLKKVDLAHNHYCSKAIYVQDVAKADERAIAIIEQLLQGSCKVSNIRRALMKQNIFLNCKQIRYQVKRIQGAPLDEEFLRKFLDKLENDGGTVAIKRASDGTIDALVISSPKMKQAFRGTSPQIVQMDSTFGLETGNYKLNAVCFHSPVTNRGEMAMLSWIASESRENLIFVLSTLKSLTDTPPNYFLIDKDLVEWNAIIEVFPQAVVLLCTRVFLKTQNVSDRAFNKQCS